MPSTRATLSPTVSGTARVALAPRLATPTQLKGYHARYFLPKRLDGAHEAIRAYCVLFRSEDLGLAQSTRPAHVLTFIARNEQPGMASYLHNVRPICKAVESASQWGRPI
jgi:hypothetical protein